MMGYEDKYKALTGLLERIWPEVYLCADSQDQNGETDKGCGPFAKVDDWGSCITCGMDVDIIPFSSALRGFEANLATKEPIPQPENDSKPD